MPLEDKNAVIYEGGGKGGGAVARAFVREMAQGLPQRSNSGEPRGGAEEIAPSNKQSR